MSIIAIPSEVLQHTELIKQSAQKYDLNPNLIMAILWQESDGNPQAVKFEAKSSLVCTPSRFTRPERDYDTEVNFQHCSWGVMQVMGFKLRELQFTGAFFELLDPALAIDFGCKVLKALKTKYVYEEDVIAAYNAGSPIMVSGAYRNAQYVSEVKEQWAFIEKLRLFA